MSGKFDINLICIYVRNNSVNFSSIMCFSTNVLTQQTYGEIQGQQQHKRKLVIVNQKHNTRKVKRDKNNITNTISF